MNLTVVHRRETHLLSVKPESTFQELQVQLEELTSVPPPRQKLLYKGKKPDVDPEATLESVGLKDGVKIQLIGSTEVELDGMRSAELRTKKRDEILRQRANANLPKPRCTTTTSVNPYTFHALVPLSHLPAPETALAVLVRLAADPAVQHIMQEHHFSVGTLTELAPHEQPHLLGLNVNVGSAIKLRLRTDVYDGFRPYLDIRRVLCHELAHNVHSEHGDNFKKLNTQLLREVAEFERTQRAGTHTLIDGPVYELSPTPTTSTPQAYILGGLTPSTPFSDGREMRRRRMLEAAEARLRKEEEELELSCGTVVPEKKDPVS